MQEFITIPTDLIKKSKKGSPFSETDAIVDILIMADKNGEFCSTTRKLMERWKWGSGKTVSFIKKLEEQNVIRTQTEHKQNTLYRMNSSFFNNLRNTNKTQTRHKQDTKEEFKKSKKEENTEIYKRIIEHLNMVCGTNYRHSSENNRRDIKARLNEGYKEDDFYVVIDKKAKEWIGTEQEKFLRPMTLFGTKFESYLNQKINKERPKNNFNDFSQREYNYDELEKRLLNNNKARKE